MDNCDRRTFARLCEDMAADYLQGNGYRILHRNFHTRRGEIDIIALDGKVLVFVEVKGKRNRDFGHPPEMVTAGKMKRIARTALEFLDESTLQRRSCRFDVVSIIAEPGKPPRLDHLKGAFSLNSA